MIGVVDAGDKEVIALVAFQAYVRGVTQLGWHDEPELFIQAQERHLRESPSAFLV